MSGWSRIGVRSAMSRRFTRKYSTATPRLSFPAQRRRDGKIDAGNFSFSRKTPTGRRRRSCAAGRACGVPRADADVAAEVALWAQMHGSDSHGIVHLPLYTRGLLDRTIKSKPNFS